MQEIRVSAKAFAGYLACEVGRLGMSLLYDGVLIERGAAMGQTKWGRRVPGFVEGQKQAVDDAIILCGYRGYGFILRLYIS